MHIQTIKIENVGGIENLSINFHPQLNLICGPNGIGKTTILECIGHLFAAGHGQLKKRKNSDAGKISALISGEPLPEPKVHSIGLSTFEPNLYDNIPGLHQYARHLLSLKTTRTFSYQPLHAVARDVEKPNSHDEAMNGIQLNEIKNWLANRYLYSAHKDALSEVQLRNLELAKRCFSLLNPNFSFSKVVASTNEIMVNTPSGEIYYEYLSSGFKSCLSILLGIIKEIEYRFPNSHIDAKHIGGITLIDELELHLHPEWQTRIASILVKAFPKMQFIATTHSPHIIQAADTKNIIALGMDNNSPTVRQLPESEYGFKGWTVEEILVDLMGLSDTRTEIFASIIDSFGKAIDNENAEDAKNRFDELDRLLHPNNHLRKLLRIQLAALKGDVDD